MIGVALALIVVGVTFVFVIPWVGVPVGIIGVVLLIAFLAGFGRRAAQFGTLRAVERRDDDADRPPVWVVEDIDHTIQWMVCPRSHRRRTRWLPRGHRLAEALGEDERRKPPAREP
jgi:hypothetical protein